MQFEEAIMEYSFDCKVRKLSAKTISNYQKQLRYLQRYLEHEYGVKEVEDVRAYQVSKSPRPKSLPTITSTTGTRNR